MTPPNYFDVVDYPEINAAYPSGDAFLQTYKGMSRDELRSRQEA